MKNLDDTVAESSASEGVDEGTTKPKTRKKKAIAKQSSANEGEDTDTPPKAESSVRKKVKEEGESVETDGGIGNQDEESPKKKGKTKGAVKKKKAAALKEGEGGDNSEIDAGHANEGEKPKKTKKTKSPPKKKVPPIGSGGVDVGGGSESEVETPRRDGDGDISQAMPTKKTPKERQIETNDTNLESIKPKKNKKIPIDDQGDQGSTSEGSIDSPKLNRNPSSMSLAKKGGAQKTTKPSPLTKSKTKKFVDRGEEDNNNNNQNVSNVEGNEVKREAASMIEKSRMKLNSDSKDSLEAEKITGPVTGAVKQVKKSSPPPSPKVVKKQLPPHVCCPPKLLMTWTMYQDPRHPLHPWHRGKCLPMPLHL